MDTNQQIRLDNLELAVNSYPRVDDYFGIWSIYEPVFRAFAERHSGLNVGEHVRQSMSQPRSPMSAEYQTTADGIAIIEIVGAMMKSPSSLAGGCSTVLARQRLRAAKRDSSVVGAILRMDTPGGTVKGNADLCADVAAFAAEKPIFSFIEDMCASAGVSVASQATKRYANTEKAVYGSMGTYGVLVDYSQAAEKAGIKVHVVRAGDFKGMGEQGSAVTDAHLAEMQRLIDGMNDSYIDMIAKGLRKSPASIRALADGRVLFATDAAAKGLIDGVRTFDQAYAELLSATKSRPGTSPAAKPSASLPTSPPANIRSETMPDVAQTRKLTTAERAESFSDHVADLVARGVARPQAVMQVAKSRPDLHQAYVDHTNHKPAASMSAANRAEVKSAWVRQVAAIAESRKVDRHKASAIAARENPTLHAQFLRATNPNSAAFD
ncbi:S49 family peptidase [Anatilimnocola floriformis]|uniref:S49 family peptidase n=1 Tax=Anatilimnocola floriformis TaxID=2948575 RepID=UPI0020C2B007|nr:S49 family peptidase [Anatilimnocola floriformis]